MILNGATAVLLCCGGRALLRERRLYHHERLKCFLHVLLALTSQVCRRSLSPASSQQSLCVCANPHSHYWRLIPARTHSRGDRPDVQLLPSRRPFHNTTAFARSLVQPFAFECGCV